MPSRIKLSLKRRPCSLAFPANTPAQNVERLICANPKLASLDSELATVYANFSTQAGNNPKLLRKEEDAWLAQHRDVCKTAECLTAAYQERIANLRDRSLRQASPAAYEQTRPFPISSASWAAAQALIGKVAHQPPQGGYPVIEGFSPDTGMPNAVVFQNGFVLVRRRGLDRLALSLQCSAMSGCLVKDVVSLPRKGPADRLLACSILDLQSHGFGVRLAAERESAGYWEVNSETGQIARQPLGVLGAEKSLSCALPETPEAN